MSDSLKGLIFWVAYFSPSIMGFVRNVPNKWGLLGWNTFLGWTVVGWFFSWTYVYPAAQRAFAMFVVAIFGGGFGSGVSAPANTQNMGDPGSGQRVCPNGADGRMTCPQCRGRGSWYEQPTTANGVARLVQCPYCQASGKVQCTVCSGSGHV